MHKEFLKLLEKATGRSEHVIAVNLDIRGFTSFCQSVAPLDIATYIKKVYLKIINSYFKNAKYYKPTGDGLILIIPFTEETLKEVANSTIKSCLDLLQRFSSLCNGEPMINYSTPTQIGVGLTRGSACCLTSEDKILDYSGGILNLASRLMDLARPSGIVFDDRFGINLLEDETKKLFSEDMVYVRGVAEERPIKIHYTERYTLIPDSYKHPLKEPKLVTDTFEYSFETLKNIEEQARLRVSLSEKPLDENKIAITFTHKNPKIEGFDLYYYYTVDDDIIEYKRTGNVSFLRISLHTLNKKFEEIGVMRDWKIKIQVVYPVE